MKQPALPHDEQLDRTWKRSYKKGVLRIQVVKKQTQTNMNKQYSHDITRGPTPEDEVPYL